MLMRATDESGKTEEVTEDNPMQVALLLKKIYNNKHLLSEALEDDVRSTTMSRAEMGRMVRVAAKSEAELRAWLNASQKTGAQGGLREVDTDGNGKVNNDDLTNEELRQQGVCKQWLSAVEGQKDGELWSLQEEPRTIACVQQSKTQITIVATAADGNKIWLKDLSPE